MTRLSDFATKITSVVHAPLTPITYFFWQNGFRVHQTEEHELLERILQRT